MRNREDIVVKRLSQAKKARQSQCSNPVARGRPLKGVSNAPLQEKTCRLLFDILKVFRLGVDLLFILIRARYFCLWFAWIITNPRYWGFTFDSC